MVLCELLQRITYKQKMYVYVINAYGQNYCVGRGVRQELLDEDIHEEFVDHLMDEVDIINVAEDRALVVRIKDKHFNEPLQNQFSEDYAKKWNNTDPESRPFLYDCEMEDFTVK